MSLPSNKKVRDLVDMFSDFFIEKISTIKRSIPHETPVFKPSLPACHLDCFNTVADSEVLKIIAQSPSKSCSLDPIPTQLLKKASSDLVPFITSIVNKSLTLGLFPDAFKCALVTPLLKKSTLNADTLKNYRPVSNLAFVSKVLEKVVNKQLHTYLSNNNLLETFQSAYRKDHSTESALLRVQNDILHAIGGQKVVLLILLDLSAAFDTVEHSSLLSILKHLGIEGTALQWFSSYLENRSQCINISGTKSDPRQLGCGVPQGSVLGPVLFTIYTSSLGRLLQQHNINYHFYADDTQLYISCKPQDIDSAIARMEACISDIYRWMCSHHLKLNSEKTEFLIISSKSASKKFIAPSIHVNGHSVNSSTVVRNIGVMMNSTASPDSHISSICKSAYLHIRNISRLRKYLHQDSLEKVIHAFISTKLDYCNSMLCGASAYQISRLQRIQNIAARLLTGTPIYEPITPILFSLHWLPVKFRIKFKVLTLVHKSVHCSAPLYLTELIHKHQVGRALRSNEQHLLSVPFTKSTLIQNCAFSVAGPKLWNELPQHIRSISSFPAFKKHLKTYIFTECFT